jgi:hypothetical protein
MLSGRRFGPSWLVPGSCCWVSNLYFRIPTMAKLPIALAVAAVVFTIGVATRGRAAAAASSLWHPLEPSQEWNIRGGGYCQLCNPTGMGATCATASCTCGNQTCNLTAGGVCQVGGPGGAGTPNNSAPGCSKASKTGISCQFSFLDSCNSAGTPTYCGTPQGPVCPASVIVNGVATCPPCACTDNMNTGGVTCSGCS